MERPWNVQEMSWTVCNDYTVQYKKSEKFVKSRSRYDHVSNERNTVYIFYNSVIKLKQTLNSCQVNDTILMNIIIKSFDQRFINIQKNLNVDFCELKSRKTKYLSTPSQFI
jgi:hypothetical protein